ncbi:MAG: LysM peptidoglycan-binding domain-containing protein, partial [Chloroflexota bacterium]
SQPRLTNPSVVAALPLGELDRAVGVQASRDDDTTASSAPAPGSSRQQTLTVPATNTPVPGSVQPVPVDGTLPTPLPEATEEVACGPPADWTEVYEVQRGDTLTRIATLYDVTIAELIDANCIDNPDRITPGDEFVVPPAPGINPNAAGTASGDTDAPAASFTAERQSITGGECVTLNWDVSGARLVSFEGDPVERSGDALVCPLATQTYSLLVVYQDGEQVGYTVTVTVNP